MGDDVAGRVDVGSYLRRWESGIRLDQGKDVAANFLDELEAYTGLPRWEVERIFYAATEEFAKEWKARPRSSTNERIRFYDESFTHIFFVLHNQAVRTRLSTPLFYLYALDMARQINARRYLDFGTGTGSGALFFAREGIDTTLADISTRMLDFARWRLQQRGVNASYMNLQVDRLPKKAFDLITCFHVLQHVANPIETLRMLRDALTDNGVLILSGAMRSDPERPMQVNHKGEKTRRKFRSVGFRILLRPTRDMRILSNVAPLVLQRVDRSPLLNFAYYIFDTAVTSESARRFLYILSYPLRGFLADARANTEAFSSNDA